MLIAGTAKDLKLRNKIFREARIHSIYCRNHISDAVQAYETEILFLNCASCVSFGTRCVVWQINFLKVRGRT